MNNSKNFRQIQILEKIEKMKRELNQILKNLEFQ